MLRTKNNFSVLILSVLYSYDWSIETGNKFILPSYIDYHKYNNKDNQIIQIIFSCIGFRTQIVHQSLLTAIYSARTQVVLTTPYLIPSNDLLQALCTASYRGVDVNVIVPEKNDNILAYWASRAFFSELLDAKVKIWKFRDGLLHTKSILIDKQLSIIGTANLDVRSLWINFEIMLAIDSVAFGKILESIHNNYISKSELIDAYKWKNRPFWNHIIETIFHFFSPLL